MTPEATRTAPPAERIRRVERTRGGKSPEPALSAKAQWAADNARQIIEWLDELGCLPAAGLEVETKSLPTRQRR